MSVIPTAGSPLNRVTKPGKLIAGKPTIISGGGGIGNGLTTTTGDQITTTTGSEITVI